MPIASKLTKLETDISNSYDVIDVKGGTIPQNKNTNNLPAAINSIQAGIAPTGTINITTNGIHDVTNYATADVNVSGGGSDDLRSLIDRSITSVQIPNSVTNIGSYAFTLCTRLSNVTIPNSVTSIGNNTFSSCTGLTSINIPDSVTSIGNNAFDSCTGLTSIVLSNSVTTIGSYAFAWCDSLTSVKVGSNLRTLAQAVFYDCRNVTKYDFTDCLQIPTLGSGNVFFRISANCKIVVPDSLYNSWISATNWSTYASQIIKESDYNAS